MFKASKIYLAKVCCVFKAAKIYLVNVQSVTWSSGNSLSAFSTELNLGSKRPGIIWNNDVSTRRFWFENVSLKHFLGFGGEGFQFELFYNAFPLSVVFYYLTLDIGVVEQVVKSIMISDKNKVHAESPAMCHEYSASLQSLVKSSLP